MFQAAAWQYLVCTTAVLFKCLLFSVSREMFTFAIHISLPLLDISPACQSPAASWPARGHAENRILSFPPRRPAIIPVQPTFPHPDRVPLKLLFKKMCSWRFSKAHLNLFEGVVLLRSDIFPFSPLRVYERFVLWDKSLKLLRQKRLCPGRKRAFNDETSFHMCALWKRPG